MTARADVTSVLACAPSFRRFRREAGGAALDAGDQGIHPLGDQLDLCGTLGLGDRSTRFPVAGLHGGDHFRPDRLPVADRLQRFVELSLVAQKAILGDGHGGEYLLFRRVHRLRGGVDRGGVLSERHVLHGTVHGDDAGVRFEHGRRHGQGMFIEIVRQPTDRLDLVQRDQAEQTGECQDGAEARQKTGQQSGIRQFHLNRPPQHPLRNQNGSGRGRPLAPSVVQEC